MSRIYRLLLITGSILMFAACATAGDDVVTKDDLSNFGNRPFDIQCVSQHVCY